MVVKSLIVIVSIAAQFALFEVINGNREGATLEVTLHDLGEESFGRLDPDVVILGSYTVSRGYLRHAGEAVQDRVFGDELQEAMGQTTVKLNRTVVVSQVPHSRLWNEIYSRSAAMAKLLAHLDLKMAELGGAPSSGAGVHASQIGYLLDLKTYLDARGIPLLIGADIARWVDGLLDAKFQP